MKLSTLGITAVSNPIVFIGKPEATGKVSSEGEEYWVWKLKKEITVRCSMDTAIEPYVTDELYLRASLLDSDLWELVDEKDPEAGLMIPSYKADFSKSQEIPIFQETTIAIWTKGNRKLNSTTRREGINAKIRERMAGKK